jgi:hypothetical protein
MISENQIRKLKQEILNEIKETQKPSQHDWNNGNVPIKVEKQENEAPKPKEKGFVKRA